MKIGVGEKVDFPMEKRLGGRPGGGGLAGWEGVSWEGGGAEMRDLGRVDR